MTTSTRNPLAHREWSPQDPQPAAAGAVIRKADLWFESCDGYQRARAVGPHLGAQLVELDVIRIDPAGTWADANSTTEKVVLVFTGTAVGTIDGATQRLSRGAALYCATGSGVSVRAETGVELYVWQCRLRPGQPISERPRRFGSLWDDATQLRNFAGTGQIAPTDRIATMNFVFWPGTGSARLCLHCGIQEPGETFSVHVHQHSEDAFIAFEGEGQMYLRDQWVDVRAGDVLFAPPTVLHGARNPHAGPTAERFVTCGGPTPFDTFLYDAAGLSSEVR
jgi:mannose-6-phosphate isomerase-like protein (cupin superfamily)